MPWRQDALPFNASTGKTYRGINVMLLGVTLYNLDADPAQGFVTYRQARAMGGHVKKGEKGTTCVFYKQYTKKDEKDEDITFGVAKKFTVFHLSQCEGIDPAQIKTPSSLSVPDTQTDALDAPMLDDEVLSSLVSMLERVDFSTRIQGDSAYYKPTQDQVIMPCMTRFHDVRDWWRVWLHEATHATGAKTRLDRAIKNTFGSKEYAFEELVAELGSTITSLELGLSALTSEELHELPHVQQHLGYVKSWIKLMEDHDQAFIEAWRLASAASHYLLAHLDA